MVQKNEKDFKYSLFFSLFLTFLWIYLGILQKNSIFAFDYIKLKTHV